VYDNSIKGFVSVRKGLNLDPNELDDIMNMKYIKTGRGVCMKSREGLKLQTSTSGAGAYDVKDIGLYTETDGTEHTLIVANSDLMEVDSSGATSKIGDLDGTRGRGVQFAGDWVIADGGHLKYYDGTSIKMCTDSGGYLADTTALDNDGTTDLHSGGTTMAGQKVTLDAWTSFSYTIGVTSATFNLKKTGTPPGNMYAKIFNSGGGLEATSDAVSASTLTTSAAEHEFTFSTACGCSASTAYYFACEYAAGSAGNKVQIGYSDTTTGDGVYTTYSGSWSDDATKDCLYKVSPGLGPKASVAEVFYNRVWTNDVDEPNRLNFSQLRDQNEWSTYGGFIYVEDGSTITAIKPFYNVLTIHLGTGYKKVLKITGSSPDTATLADSIIVGAAAINQDCVVNVGNDLLFLDAAGLVSMRAWENFGDFKMSVVSEPVANLVTANVDTTRFMGYNKTDQQVWLDVGSTSYILVYDNENRIWTKYWFELGTSVTPTCFAEFNGVTYVGDSAGHLWKMDQIDRQYKDNVTDYTMMVRYPASKFGTLLKKQARFVNALARTRTGGDYDIIFYKNLDRDSFLTKEIDVPFDPDLTVDEATMAVDDADWVIDDVTGNLYLTPVNFEFNAIQIGIENINVTGYPMIIQGCELHAALLSRR
jgi:hypothetical protein